MFLRNPSTRSIFHPVPIDLGEIRKLCEIDHSDSGRDRELIGQTCRVPLSRLAPANPDPRASTGLPSGDEIWGVSKRPTVLDVGDLRPPLFELLRPSVVIRRRPQRSDPPAGFR